MVSCCILFWPNVRKNCSSDWEKRLKFEAEGQNNFGNKIPEIWKKVLSNIIGVTSLLFLGPFYYTALYWDYKVMRHTEHNRPSYLLFSPEIIKNLQELLKNCNAICCSQNELFYDMEWFWLLLAGLQSIEKKLRLQNSKSPGIALI